VKRVIYAPTKGDLLRADSLARELNLPIQVGDSISTSEMDFDRKELQVLMIPNLKIADIPNNIYSQITFNCKFTNDWINFLEADSFITIEDKKSKYTFPPRLKEIHFLKFAPKVSDPGVYLLSLTVDEELCFESDIIVL
jgi:hypothetical protein